MDFKVGYALANINPKMGYGIMGYYIPRYVKGFLDDLETSAVVIGFDERKIAIISVDVCSLTVAQADKIKEVVCEKTSISVDDIFISTIHTHTGPLLTVNSIFNTTEEEIEEYNKFLMSRIADVVAMAIEDLKPAKMGYGVGSAPV